MCASREMRYWFARMFIEINAFQTDQVRHRRAHTHRRTDTDTVTHKHTQAERAKTDTSTDHSIQVAVHMLHVVAQHGCGDALAPVELPTNTASVECHVHTKALRMTLTTDPPSRADFDPEPNPCLHASPTHLIDRH